MPRFGGKKKQTTYTFKNRKGAFTTTDKRPRGWKARDWDKQAKRGCMGCAPILLLAFSAIGGMAFQITVRRSRR